MKTLPLLVFISTLSACISLSEGQRPHHQLYLRRNHFNRDPRLGPHHTPPRSRLPFVWQNYIRNYRNNKHYTHCKNKYFCRPHTAPGENKPTDNPESTTQTLPTTSTSTATPEVPSTTSNVPTTPVTETTATTTSSPEVTSTPQPSDPTVTTTAPPPTTPPTTTTTATTIALTSSATSPPSAPTTAATTTPEPSPSTPESTGTTTEANTSPTETTDEPPESPGEDDLLSFLNKMMELFFNFLRG